MSYVKDLMAVTADWVKLNPTASGMLKIPRTPQFRKDRSYLERYEREAAEDPAKAEQLRATFQQLRELHDKVDAEYAKIQESEDQIEYHVNQIDVTGETKYTIGRIAPDTTRTALHGRWSLAWAHAGYNVFELSNDFVAAMLLTDPRAIDFDALRPPFAGILITIPAGFATGIEGLPYTKIHLSFVDESWGLFAFDGNHVLDMHVAEGQHMCWDLFDHLNPADAECKIEGADAAAMRTIRQIVFGMLAYVTSVDRAIELRPEPSKKKRGKDDCRVRPRVHDVGRNVKIDPVLVKYAREGAREVAFRLKHRHIVRGHYRNQAHGPGMRDRKNIWIEPYWKGPEDGAVLQHTYKPALAEGNQ